MARRKTVHEKKQAGKKRSKTKTPGLQKNLFAKVKQEYHDLDYIDTLSAEEKEFMSQFMEEWLGARLNHERDKMHSTKAERKRVYDMNNARQRDIYSQARAMGKLEMPGLFADFKIEEHYNPEEDLVAAIDEAKETEFFESNEDSGDTD